MNPRNNNMRSVSSEPEFDRDVLDIARVTRTVAGGRRFSFRATIAIGNRKGMVGVGVGKGKDVVQSMDKAYRKAQKEMVRVVKDDGTIPVDMIGHFKSARVLLRPARKGKGLIAGGAVRALCNLAGIENISAKILSKSNNKLNIARATLDAFKQIEKLASKTGVKSSSQKVIEKKEVLRQAQGKTVKNVGKDKKVETKTEKGKK